MKRILCIIVSAFLAGTLVCSSAAANTISTEEAIVDSTSVEKMEIVSEPLPFGFEIVSVGEDGVSAKFVSQNRIASQPYVGIKGTKTSIEITDDLLYPLEYATEYSFVYTVIENNNKIVYNSFFEVESGIDGHVVFGDVIKNTIPTETLRAAGQINESESNNSFSTADITYDDYDNVGYLSSLSDVDWWKVSFTQAGTVNFWLGNIPSGCDYDITLFNAAGVQIGYSTNSGQEAELIQYTVTANTYYYIKISSYSGYSSSQYLFRAKNYTTPQWIITLYSGNIRTRYTGSATLSVRGHYDNYDVTLTNGTGTIDVVNGRQLAFNVRAAGYHTYVLPAEETVTGNKSFNVILTPVDNDIISCGFTHPLRVNTYTYSSNFGWRSYSYSNGYYGKFNKHLGLDLSDSSKPSIYSICDVSASEFYSNYDSARGNYIVVTDTDSGRTITYEHLDYQPYPNGLTSTIYQGNIIGTMGNTGESTGTHLHIQIYDRGENVYHDPYLYFN